MPADTTVPLVVAVHVPVAAQVVRVPVVQVAPVAVADPRVVPAVDVVVATRTHPNGGIYLVCQIPLFQTRLREHMLPPLFICDQKFSFDFRSHTNPR